MRKTALTFRVTALVLVTCITALLAAATETRAATASANATATVVTPLAISKTADMAFGKFVAGTGGTVVLNSAGSRSATGNVTLFTQGSTQNAAAFNVTGEGSYTYAITLPASDVTLSDGASHTMTVNGFTSNPSGTGTLSGGAQALAVGATLTVGNAQAPGSYTGSFSVTVDYN